jgi:hypothetical protein
MPNYTIAGYPSTHLSFNLGPALLELYAARLTSGIGVDWSDTLPSEPSAANSQPCLPRSSNADGKPTQQATRMRSRTS